MQNTLNNQDVKIGVVSFSGGQDSTTVLSYAKNHGYELYALSFMYGQTLNREIDQARQICNHLDVNHMVFDVSAFKDIAWYSALTNPNNFQIPQYENHGEIQDNIPFTYVPLRNTFFITCCAAFLESVVLDKIEKKHVNPVDVNAVIFHAANNIDYSNYPDCRPDFFKKIEEVILQGSKIGSYYKTPIKIDTPLINMSKKEITELGVELGAPLHLTHTCYVGEEVACGRCPSCLLRIKGFKEAGYIDPLKYNIPIDWMDCKPIKSGQLV